MFRSLFEVLTELDAVDVGRDCFEWSAILDGGVGFGVKGVDVGHATRHVEVDDVFGFAF
jgi:hypothetical protein